MATIRWLEVQEFGMGTIEKANITENIIGAAWVKELEKGERLIVDPDGDRHIIPNQVIITDNLKYKGTVAHRVSSGQMVAIGHFTYNKEEKCIFLSQFNFTKVFQITGHPDFPLGEKKGSCYIASCVYGSYDCPEVYTLRRFRDNTLARFYLGRQFIRVYYATSPKFVNLFGKRQWFNTLFRPILNKLVRILKKWGYECTPYQDRR